MVYGYYGLSFFSICLFFFFFVFLQDVFVAGTDPGAATLVWAMAEVTKNPGGKKKAQEELCLEGKVL